MTNYKHIAIGNGIFLVSYLGALITSYLFPTFMDVMTTAFSDYNLPDSTFQGIGWIGIILIWVLSMLVAPNALIIMGLQEPKNAPSPMLEITKGVTWAICSTLVIYFAWDWVNTLSTAINTGYTLLLVLFYMSIISMIIMNTIAIPAYIIIKNKT